MDYMVQAAQEWLNKTYKGQAGYTKVPEDGKTGWPTINGLIIALQIELGMTNRAPSFGPTTVKYFTNKFPNGIKQQKEYDNPTSNIYNIIQGAMWCKGYSPSASMDGHFYERMGIGIKKLKDDMGLGGDSTVDLNVMKALLSMQQFVLLDRYGGREEIRTLQQHINRNYREYTGIIPCDGLYGREMNKALIQILQSIQGYTPATATGNFGGGTKSKLVTITNSNAGKYPKFVWIASAALMCNGYKNKLTENFNEISDYIKEFQTDYALTINGQLDVNTWMSLFISKGNPDRSSKACDCSTVLNEQQAKDLRKAGYTHVGRYLTGTVKGERSKAITLDEIENIKKAGLKLFPIYQDGGNEQKYFINKSQGYSDAKAAIAAAKNLGIPENTTIYFAVDFDAYEYVINDYIMPYFGAIKFVFNSYKLNSKGYKVGVYGPRLLCTKLYDHGYTTYSFVSDLSTGFSGNLGYSIPKNWAFDQFCEYTFKSSPNFGLDKDAFSGRDNGILEFDKVEYKSPDELAKEENANNILIRQLEYISDIMSTIGLQRDIFSAGVTFDQDLPLKHIEDATASINISCKISEGVSTHSNATNTFKIETDKEGNLTASCENAIHKIILDSKVEDKNKMVENILKNMALGIKLGTVTVLFKVIDPYHIILTLDISSNDLLPNIKEVDSNITCSVIYDIRIKPEYKMPELNLGLEPVTALAVGTVLLGSVVLFISGAGEIGTIAAFISSLFQKLASN